MSVATPGALQVASDERELQREGRELLFALHAAVRALRLYPLENQAVQNAVAELERVAGEILEREDEVSVRYVGDFFFVNDLRLRMDLASFATFGALGRTLARHEIGEVAILRGVARAEWISTLTLLLSEPGGEHPFAAFSERLVAVGVARLAFEERLPGDEKSDAGLSREVAKRTYAHTVAVVREVMGAKRMGKGVSLRLVKRAIQSIVDQVLNNETSIIGMTTLRDHDEYTFVHSVNVCIFSVALGKRLGFDKRELYELGLGALMHDVGKSRLPLEVMNKSTALDGREWEILKEHTTEGMLTLFGMGGLSEPPLRAMLTAYEHHMKIDLTGYPESRRPRKMGFFSRIVAIADGFDAATTERVYQRAPLQPDEVLRGMTSNPTRGFDPLLVRAFIGMTGIYPVGTLVVLDSYELAVVVAPNPDPRSSHLPIVRVIYDELGIPVDPPRLLDLSEPDSDTGAPMHRIIKTTDPERYGIHVGDYFV